MQVTKKQIEVLDAEGHLLITGGPGSGKTTVSILKAAQIVEHRLQPGQKVLFLSFARATVSRVMEAVEYEQKIPATQKSRISIQTYHSFFWRILKTHGYLIGLPRWLQVMTPPAEAIVLSEIRSQFPVRNVTSEQKIAKRSTEDEERKRLATIEGRICFDLFAPYVAAILQSSQRIRHLIATIYPVVILDEFQDTSSSQWNVIKLLGTFCHLIALADPQQCIYGWLDADPKRLNHFCEQFFPIEIELGAENHRSSSSEIKLFAEHMLKGKFFQTVYRGVSIEFFDSFPDLAIAKLLIMIGAMREQFIRRGVEDWSLAILVPTKKMTRLVSDKLHRPSSGMAKIAHSVVIEMESAFLAAEIIAFLLQPDVDNLHFRQFITLLCNYFRGKNGDKPTKKDLNKATGIKNHYEDLLTCQATGKAIRKNSIVVNIRAVYEQTRALVLTGDPSKDWQAMRRILEEGMCKELNEIAEEVRNIRMLERGMQLRQALSQDWRDNGEYQNALAIIRLTYNQEYFSTNPKLEKGIVVMNMHKVKGKQFDGVIIFEGWPYSKNDRIVRGNLKTEINEQIKQNLYVSVTRAKSLAVIFTPQRNPCILLKNT